MTKKPLPDWVAIEPCPCSNEFCEYRVCKENVACYDGDYFIGVINKHGFTRNITLETWTKYCENMGCDSFGVRWKLRIM